MTTSRAHTTARVSLGLSLAAFTGAVLAIVLVTASEDAEPQRASVEAAASSSDMNSLQ